MTDEGLGQTDEDGVVAFVLDGMPAAEREAFELQLENDGEMRRLVTEYRNCLGELSLSAPQEDPPPDMLQKIRARIDDAEMAWQREPQNRERRPILWVGWAVAAGFAVLAAVLYFSQPDAGEISQRGHGRGASTSDRAHESRDAESRIVLPVDNDSRTSGDGLGMGGGGAPKTVYRLRQDIETLEKQVGQLKRLHEDRFRAVPGRARLLVVEMRGTKEIEPNSVEESRGEGEVREIEVADSVPRPIPDPNPRPSAEPPPRPEPTQGPVSIVTPTRDLPTLLAGVVVQGLQQNLELEAQLGFFNPDNSAIAPDSFGVPDSITEANVFSGSNWSAATAGADSELAAAEPSMPESPERSIEVETPARQAAGYTIFDETSGEGAIIVQDLAPPSEGSDYQLWIVDPRSEEPISAGLLPEIEEGSGRIDFNGLGSVPSGFFVTEEPKNGSELPTGAVIISGPPE